MESTHSSVEMASLSQNSDTFAPPRALAFIFGVAVLDLLGLTLLMPVIPFLVRQYEAGAFYVTLMTVIYAAAQFLAAPLLGRLSDRYGRKPVLLICLFVRLGHRLLSLRHWRRAVGLAALPPD